MLYYYYNRRHRGEIWLAFRTPRGITLQEQTGKAPEDGVLLGEVETRVVDGKFENRIVPVRERSEEELRRRRQQADRHKAYRAELYRRYPLAERMADLR
jgi:hypothetical protein